jgi:hypothetical protein
VFGQTPAGGQMMSMAFVEQPESASTKHHHTVNHARAAAALPGAIGEPGSDFMTKAMVILYYLLTPARVRGATIFNIAL